jgi:uncharacterized protein (TIGR03067 family)
VAVFEAYGGGATAVLAGVVTQAADREGTDGGATVGGQWPTLWVGDVGGADRGAAGVEPDTAAAGAAAKRGGRKMNRHYFLDGSIAVLYMSRRTGMRISLVALFCAIGFAASGGSGILADDKAELEKELRKFQGTWTFQSSESGGKELPAGDLKGLIVIFEGDKHTVKNGDEVIQVGTQKLDTSKSPKTIDVTMTEGPNKGAVMLGIYEIDEDTLKVCFDPQGKKRPTQFKSAPDSENFVNVHKRVKK